MKRTIPRYLTLVMVLAMITSCIFPKVVLADNLTVTGNNSYDAIITDNHGNVISHDASLNEWTNYQVTYHWKIDNSQDIQPNDTIIFTLPDNVQVWTPLEFPVTFNGNVVGSFKIAKGSKTGTLTFNDYIQKHNLTNIEGKLNITVVGTHDTNTVPGWMINKSGWIGDNNNPTWNIAMNSNGDKLGDIEVTDIMSNNQKYIDGSAIIQYGYYDQNSQFIVERVDNNPIVIQNGNKLTFKIDNVCKSVQIRYQTTPTVSQGTLSNKVILSGNKIKGGYTDIAHIKYYGNGNIEGVYPNSTSVIQLSKSSTKSSEQQEVSQEKSSTKSSEQQEISQAKPINKPSEQPEVTSSNVVKYSENKSSRVFISSIKSSKLNDSSEEQDYSNNHFKNECHLTRAEKKNKKHLTKITINNNITNDTQNNNKSIDNINDKKNKQLPQTNEKLDFHLLLLGNLLVLISITFYLKNRRV